MTPKNIELPARAPRRPIRKIRQFLTVSAILASGAGAACPLSGTGTEASPHLVATYADLLEVGVGECGVAASYRLVSDIDASASVETPFEPIGRSAGFEGRFHGAGHSISNLVVGSSGIMLPPFVGLFGVLKSPAVVDSLAMVSETIDGGRGMQTDSTAGIGGIAGKSAGTISNCTIKANLTGPHCYKIGGVVGYNDHGRIENCVSSAYVSTMADSVGLATFYQSAVDTIATSVGGVAGRSTGRVFNSVNLGRVEGVIFAGGVVGRNDGEVVSCHSSGPVKGVSSSRWIVTTVGATGGVVGLNARGGRVGMSYAVGEVVGKDSSSVGGIAGTNKGSVSDCYSHASVTGMDGSPAGGLVGIYANAAGVVRAYSDGRVDQDGSTQVGGLFGFSVDSCPTCYWDGLTSRQQRGTGTLGYVAGKLLTSDEMLHAASFPALFFGKASPWRIDEGQGTPTLASGATNLSPLRAKTRIGSNMSARNRVFRTRTGISADLTESVVLRIVDLSGRRSAPDRILAAGRQDVSLAGIAGTVLVELSGASGKLVVPLVETNR